MLDYVVNRVPATRERVRQELMAGLVPHWVRRSKRANYIRQVLLSCPPWADRDALKLIQLLARQLSELTGEEHHVCHRVPLSHPRVCGLTVPWNLEIKTAKINLAESNNIHLDEQLSLFTD